ncbi:glycosyltransferase family 39 protein [Acidocella sp.]|uniref:ArnT family glycosyltransferase n=1 Tax=Acidocella sp. TaxID=50710 RepID=UPI0026205627|nr:glycosyltransferase family 39 protein [Acidocella sp.]
MKATLWLIALATLLRLVFAGYTGLGIDESYMVAAAHTFDASYFDHPLASWWLELTARALTGSAAPLVVRLPFVIMAALTSWLLFVITARLYDERAGFWAVVAYSVSPVFSMASGCWVLPDGPVDLALTAFMLAVLRAPGLIGGKPRPMFWLAAGLFAGLAMLSKYNAALVIAGVGLGLLLTPQLRGEFRRPQLWLGVLLSLVLAAPVLWWNANHGWVSLHYQGGRVAGLHLRPYMPLYVWAGEALFVLPWLWLPMIWAQIRALRAGPAQAAPWLLAWAGLIPVLLFAAISIWSSTHILFHWAAPGELMLFPLLGAWARGISPGLRAGVASASGALLAGAMLFITAEVQFAFLPHLDMLSKPGKSPLLQIIDWTSIGAQIPPGIDAIAAQRWYDAGKVGYALALDHIDIPVTVFAGGPHQFAFSAPPASFIGKNVLVLSMPWSMEQTASFCASSFQSFTPGPVLTVTFHNSVLLAIPTYIGHDMRAVPTPTKSAASNA